MFDRIYQLAPAPLQTLFLNAIAWRKHRYRFTGDIARERRHRMRALERAPREEIERDQLDRLRTLVAHASATIPYYKESFRRAGVVTEDLKTLDDIRRLPILTRLDVQRSFDGLESASERRNRIRVARTSGTTGTPLRFSWDRESEWWNSAAYYGHRAWYDVAVGDPHISLLGRMIVSANQTRPPFWRHNRVINQLLMSTFHLRDENMPAYVDKIAEFKPKLIEAYPSTAYILARFMNARRIRIPVHAVTTSSEPLLAIQREAIEQAFDTKVFDYFGAAERVMAAGECTAHDGLHVFEPFGITEILDENHDPVPPGVHGRLVLTGLNNRVMPLIRYEIGDASAWIDGPCPCGRTWRRISPVTTKAEDILVTPSGRLISPSLLTHAFKPLDNVAASQILQEVPERMLVKIVRRPAYTDADTAQLLTALHERLGHEIDIEIRFVEEIARGRTGKLRWVISKVPLDMSSTLAEQSQP